MQCRSVLTRVDALRTGELPPTESGEVKKHLETCSSCEESLTDVGSLVRAVKSIVTAPPQSCRAALTDHFDVLEVQGVRVHIAFSERGLTMITAAGSDEEFRSRYCDRFAKELKSGSLPDRLRRQVVSALSGEGVEKPVVDFIEATEFERSVLKVLTKIPRGEVRSYSWVAQQAGRPGAVRAVGTICANNVVPFVVPCHRVVPTTGGIGNYAFGERMKRKMLEREGVAVRELELLARKGIRFIGSKTTHIFCNPTCKDARRIRDDNRVPLHDSAEAAKKGFRPCRRCQPIAA
jgi:O-6-methylguanine DNA methyltransferase